MEAGYIVSLSMALVATIAGFVNASLVRVPLKTSLALYAAGVAMGSAVGFALAGAAIVAAAGN